MFGFHPTETPQLALDNGRNTFNRRFRLPSGGKLEGAQDKQPV
jgi:hypothetical protein